MEITELDTALQHTQFVHYGRATKELPVNKVKPISFKLSPKEAQAMEVVTEYFRYTMHVPPPKPDVVFSSFRPMVGFARRLSIAGVLVGDKCWETMAKVYRVLGEARITAARSKEEKARVKAEKAMAREDKARAKQERQQERAQRKLADARGQQSSTLGSVVGAITGMVSWFSGTAVAQPQSPPPSPPSLPRRQPTVGPVDLPPAVVPANAFQWMIDRTGIGGYESARMRELAKIFQHVLRKPKHANEKIVVVSAWVEALDLVKDMLEIKFDQLALMIHGSIKSKAMRDTNAGIFNTDDSRRVMLITYGAGGVGLNLQRANHIVLLDGQWNDSTRGQAIARVLRLGQRRTPVIIYELVAETFIDEMMVEKLLVSQWVVLYLVESPVLQVAPAKIGK